MDKKWYKWPGGYYNEKYPYRDYKPWYCLALIPVAVPLLAIGFLILSFGMILVDFDINVPKSLYKKLF